MSLRRLARCRIRDRHDWRVVAVSTALPSLGLPPQYRAICRTCSISGGPVLVRPAGVPAAAPGTPRRAAADPGPREVAAAGALRAGRPASGPPARRSPARQSATGSIHAM